MRYSKLFSSYYHIEKRQHGFILLPRIQLTLLVCLLHLFVEPIVGCIPVSHGILVAVGTTTAYVCNSNTQRRQSTTDGCGVSTRKSRKCDPTYCTTRSRNGKRIDCQSVVARN